jgi:hypothetical protein
MEMKVTKQGRVVFENGQIVEVSGFEVEYDVDKIDEAARHAAQLSLVEWVERHYRFEPENDSIAIIEPLEEIITAHNIFEGSQQSQHGIEIKA